MIKPVALKIANLKLWGEGNEDEAPPHTDEIRHCTEPGCITILNGFNLDNKCWRHRDAKVDPEFLSKLGMPPESQMQLKLIGLTKKRKGERRLFKVRKRAVMPGQEQLFLPVDPDWEKASTGNSSVDKFIKSVAARFGTTITDVISGSHKQPAVSARAVAAWHLRDQHYDIIKVIGFLNIQSRGNFNKVLERGKTLVKESALANRVAN